MITIDEQITRDIPFLHIVKAENKDKPLPLVFFIHGFTSAREHNLHFAFHLAEKGMRVILPDCSYHGVRSENLNLEELASKFWEIVLNEIREIDILKTYFQEKQLIEADLIGVAGTSMGGITTFGALAKHDWIKAAVSLMGSPNYTTFLKAQIMDMRHKGLMKDITDEEVHLQLDALRPYDLTLQTDRLNKRPLLFWHAENDPVVPYRHAKSLYDELASTQYKQDPHLIRFITDGQAGHKVSRQAMFETIDWFVTHLKSTNV
ncbi:prolyl oligopeptidase family serine peptidase [Bacillus safensis]|uniref:alpha/beta fold hydrolase n=1 Tax=Bacillus TaxID=1386 RepID=UPI00119F4E03|nr:MULTISPECIES: alpha/beta fold hydrolase [Bacillus]MCY7585394.1 prolyl oligopeptidase family serine peptidase [Bacillus safensis]MCY7586829.1 prolyl oligopeptidase family serine peptidase [Bacillus safensis]MCY7609734.1 prolyl oligopeptidase family serine peptidase [Bacillus safensis]